MNKDNSLDRRNFIKSSAFATAGLFIGGKGTASTVNEPNKKGRQPHIIFIMTDQQRGDALGCVNNRVKTPHIDSIANQGILFYNGYSSVPSSTPARAGLLTGFSPWNHGMLGYGRVARRYKYEMPRMLRDLGYYTFGIGKMHWYPQKSLHGFNGTLVDESGREEQDGFVSDYRDWFKLNAPGLHPDATGIGFNEHRAGTYKLREDVHPTYWTGQTAVELIENYQLDNPLFLKVSFARPHSPYDPPKRYLDMYKAVDIPAPAIGEWASKFADFPETPNAAFGDFGKDHAINSRRHYYANITFIDDQIGHIIHALKKKGMYDDAIICFTSDHGDMLGDHHHWRKTYPYEGSARVPFLMKWPEWMAGNVERGTTMTQPVELRDFLPTFLDAAGGDIPEDMDGLSLLSLVRNPSHKWRRYIDMEHATAYSDENYWCALTDGKFKYAWYFRTGKEELFDLINDRNELINLADKSQSQSELLKWRKFMVEHLRERGESFVKDNKLVLCEETLLYGPNYPEDENLTQRQRAAQWKKFHSESYKISYK